MVVSVHRFATGVGNAVCFVAALRSLWLLPDWLAKWQSVLARRRHPARRTSSGDDEVDCERTGRRSPGEPGPSAARDPQGSERCSGTR